MSLDAQQIPAYKSWCAHARMLAVALQHELTADEVSRLDQMVVNYLILFNKVSNVPRNVPRNVARGP